MSEQPTLESLPMMEEEPPTLSEKDRAFVMSADGMRSVPFSADGSGADVKLRAFDDFRLMAAQSMGLRFFNMTEDDISEFKAHGTYDELYMDAIISVCLCTKPEEFALKAIDHPKTYKKQILQWAKKQGIRPGTERHGEVIEAFGQIINDISVSSAEVDETGLPEVGESLGESQEESPKM